VRNFCNRIIWLQHGQIIADGDADSVIKEYERSNG
jgi:ABC-type polysaccharide/polyol phosphate transport system ATPase subunit